MTTAGDAELGQGPAAVEYEIDWTVEQPEFEFTSEGQALKTVQMLGEDLAAARKQVEHTMRYLRAAVVAARQPLEDGKPVRKR
ncbi:hypothetical protein AB0F91_46010 [Amycolatopsis sp. NPDC023774]|uniref:hypothetical protein n=1 Tax=Amycolatopsis sp. NPDC023774 TaxID=3155015 RepID=UPI00340F2D0C